jgi:AcrR family transcriptional regulator
MSRRAFKPTTRERRRVELLIGEISEDAIAETLGIARGTLRKHFASELRLGYARVLADNLERLDKAASKGNVAAMRALLARKAELPAPAGDSAAAEQAHSSRKLAKKAKRAGVGTAWQDFVDSLPTLEELP